jgi:PKD repeat protein
VEPRGRKVPGIVAGLVALVVGAVSAAGAGAPCSPWEPVPVSFRSDGLTYGNGLFVAVGDNGTIQTSPDGGTWTPRAGTTGAFDDVLWSGSQFLAVGCNGALATSPDGVTWTPRSAFPSTLCLRAVAWNGTQYVAVGYDSTATPGQVWTSFDGLNWVLRTNSSASQGFYDIVWNGSRFVAVASGGTIQTSLDGATWSSKNVGSSVTLSGIAWDGNHFVAATTSQHWVFTSPDGESWTQHTDSHSARAILWTGTRFIAVEGPRILTSLDGITWALENSGGPSNLYDIAWNGEMAVAAGGDGVLWRSHCQKPAAAFTFSPLHPLRGEPVAFTDSSSGAPTSWQWNFGDGQNSTEQNPVHIYEQSGVYSVSLAVSDGTTTDQTEQRIEVSLPTQACGPWEPVPVSFQSNGLTYGNGLFVAVGNNGTIQTSPDGGTWTPRTGTTGAFDDVLWSGSQFLAVGCNGALATSPDGMTWTPRSAFPSTLCLRAVAWNGTQYVAVGYDSTATPGQVWTSFDGLNWVFRTNTSASQGFYDIVWNGSRFVAVASGGTIRTSLDGATWSSKNVGSSVTLSGIAWNGNHFVAATTSQHWVFTSPDGESWAQHTDSHSASAILWTGTRFISIEGSRILTSLDGITWTLENSGGPSNLNDIAWNGETAIAAGGEGALWRNHCQKPTAAFTVDPVHPLRGEPVAFTDSSFGAPTSWQWNFGDGQNSTEQNPVHIYEQSGVYSVSLAVSDGTTTDQTEQRIEVSLPTQACGPWEPVPVSFQSNGLTYGNGLFVAVGDNGSIQTSPDGKTWTPGTGTTSTFDDVLWSGSQFLAVGCSGVLATSPDGMTWTPRSAFPSNLCLRAVAWNGTRYAAVGYSSTINAPGQIWTSLDGLNWFLQTSTSANQLLSDILWNGSRFVAVGRSGITLTSLDGIIWSSKYIGSSVSLSGIAWDGSRFVVTSASGNLLYTSPDGESWTEHTDSPTAEAILWTGTRFIAVFDYRLSTSLDGVTWTLESDGGPATFNDIAWNGEIAIVAGSYGALWRSGCQGPTAAFTFNPFHAFHGQPVTFADTSFGAPTSWQWNFGDGQASNQQNPLHTYAQSGVYSVSLTVSDGAVTDQTEQRIEVSLPTQVCSPWEPVPASFQSNGLTYGNGLFVAVGDNGSIQTSPDGKTWTPGTGTTSTFDDVLWSGSQFLAVGCSGALATSLDGVTWTPRSAFPSNLCLRAVAWNGTRYVAVGYSSTINAPGQIWTSRDGLNWFFQTSTSANQLLSDILWNGSRFVAVGHSGITLTSVDGIIWSSKYIGSSVRLSGIAWDGSQFVVTSTSANLLYTSPDGESWTMHTDSPTAEAILWTGTRFIAVFDYRLSTSLDGVTWTLENNGGPVTLNDIAWNGEIAIVAGSYGALWRSDCRQPTTAFTFSPAEPSRGQLVSFSDTSYGAPTAWLWNFGDGAGSVRRDPQHAYAVSGDYIVSLTVSNGTRTSRATRKLTVSRSAQSCSLWAPFSASLRSDGITYGKGSFVAVSTNGTVQTSPDGQSWTQRASSLGNLSDVVWTGSQFLAVGCNSNLATSPDGMTWTTRSAFPSNLCLLAVAWNGTQYVAVGYTNIVNTTGQVWTSYDGLHWVFRVQSERLIDVLWSGSQFVAVGRSGRVLTSQDGTDWTFRSVGTTHLSGIAWNGSRFVAIAESTNIVYTSPDGVSWTARTGTARAANAVTWAGTRFVAVGNNSQILTSPDGITWTLENGTGSSTLYDVAWNGDVAVAAGSAGQVWRSACRDVTRIPEASFTWSPASPTTGQPVQFSNTSFGEGPTWAWDFDSDGITDSTAQSPIHTFATPGPHGVSLRATNAYGSHRTTHIVTVSGAPLGTPVITRVQRELPGFFLQGTQAGNRFTVDVDWQGSPGSVSFSINGGAAIVAPGTPTGASHAFQIGSDFPPRFQASTITLRATNGAGILGPVWTETVFLFPHPPWLQQALSFGGDLEFHIGGGEVRASVGFEFPEPHLEGKIHIPSFVPYIGGDLGFEETFAQIEGEISSLGTGSLSVSGQTGFVAMDQPSLSGSVRGSGEFRLLPPTGLELTGASFVIGLSGSIEKEVGIVEAIPVLAAAADWPIVSWFNESATLTGEISPSLELAASFAQKEDGSLGFRESTGMLGLDLTSTLEVDIIPRLTASAWVAGGGSALVGVPSPFFRELEINVEAGADLKVDYFFDAWEGRFRCQASCTWTNGSGIDCPADCDAAGLSTFQPAGSLTPIRIKYDRFGDYSRFSVRQLARPARSIVPISVTEASVVSNVFPGASPQLIPAPGGPLLLWEHQDTADPIIQSTEISWSFESGSGWTPPALLADDTRAELTPVAGTDANGRVVAAWLRIKDPDFSVPIQEVADLPLFYTRLEVVSAVFDPVAQTWGPMTQLTEDTALDTDLRLSSDSAGNLLLTWLSNPDGELLSTPESPSTLRFSIWNAATQAWSAPATAAFGLVGVASHTGAVRGTQAFLLVSRDPNLAMADDGVLDLLTWDGTAWSAPSLFAGGGVENRIPTAIYDANGEGHVVWFRDGDLVQATLTDPTPRTLRSGSGSMAFFGLRFLTNPQGNLTLLWQEVADNQPANLFARVFDPASGSWSDDRRLTAEEEVKHHSVSGFYGADGVLRAVYLATQIGRTTREVELEGQNVTLINIPEDGRTDLRLLDHSLIVDLAVVDADLTLDPASPEPGETVTATLAVHNAGDFPVGSFDVALYAGDPEEQGILVATQRVTGPFAAGGRLPLTFTFVYPAGGGSIAAVIDAAAEVTELAEGNNLAMYHLANRPPQAVILATVTSGLRPLTVEFDASASYDPDGDALRFDWSFGDGGTGSGPAMISHSFTRSGRFPVAAIVTDSKGAVGTAIVLITVDGPEEVDSGTDFYALSPCRVYDSRTSGQGQPLASDVPRTLQAAGVCAIPGTAKAISVTVTVSSPTDRGRVTLYPGGIGAPVTSTLNFPAGVNRANNAIIPLAPDGAGTLGALAFVNGGGTVHLIVDVTGYFQ